jgi:Na+-transporting NADH:ubiquinone oxidoreductase subunit NqrC
MKKGTQKIIYAVIIMALIAASVIYAFFRMTSEKEEDVPKTKVAKLISKNLEGNYPATPREVVKTYGELTKYLYNGSEEEKMTDEQFEALFDQVRILYSAELLEKNPRETQLAELKKDVADYKKSSKTIMSYSVQESSQITYGELNGKESATVKMTFTTKASGEQPAKTYEEFLLQEDEEGHWKILGWQQVGSE